MTFSHTVTAAAAAAVLAASTGIAELSANGMSARSDGEANRQHQGDRYNFGIHGLQRASRGLLSCICIAFVGDMFAYVPGPSGTDVRLPGIVCESDMLRAIRIIRNLIIILDFHSTSM